MKKYYAVKSGRTPGIYMTWEDCKAQVNGFSNPEYKSFTDVVEAAAFIEGNAAISHTKESFFSNSPAGQEMAAYVDGSYLENTGEYSYGMVIFLDGEEIQLSGKEADIEMASMRNVAGEITGARKAMEYAVEHGCSKVTIYHDYEGIAKWCLGLWKTNKKGTMDYKAYYDSIKDKIEVSFVKVKGHSGNVYNDMADTLAKKALGINT